MDQNPDIAWLTAAESARPVVRVEPLTPVDVDSVTIVPVAPGEGIAPVRSVQVTVYPTDGPPTSFGSSVPLQASEAGVDVDVGVRSVGALEIELEVGDHGASDLVGLAEIEIGTPAGQLDGREYLRVPAPAALQAAPASADLPIQYLFTRYGPGRGAQADLRRELWLPGLRPVEIGATFRVDDATPDQVVDELLGSVVGAFATSRAAGSIEGSGVYVLDEDPATAWQVDADDPGELTVRLDGQLVDQVEIQTVLVADLPVRFERVTSFEVVVSGAEGRELTVVDLPDEPRCATGVENADENWCVERVVVDLEPQPADRVTIRPTEIDSGAEEIGSPPARVARVQLRSDRRDLVTPEATAPATGCRPLVELDDRTVGLRPARAPTLDSLVEGVVFESCEPVELGEGWHRVANRVGLVHAMADLAIGPGPGAPPSPAREVTVESSTSSKRQLSAVVEPGDLVVTAVPFHDGWRVDASGVPGSKTSADGFVAWRSEGTGTVRLELAFGPQRIYKAAWVLTALTLAVCLWLLIPPTRKR